MTTARADVAIGTPLESTRGGSPLQRSSPLLPPCFPLKFSPPPDPARPIQILFESHRRGREGGAVHGHLQERDLV